MPQNPKKKLRWLVLTAAVTGLLATALAQPATAQTTAPPLAAPITTASTYYYNAGHPMQFTGPGPGVCTGAYTITGASGAFILTAGHCAGVGSTVYGTSSAFGTVAHRKMSPNGDSELISYYSNVTPYQIIVDPKTGNRPGPGGLGQVTGIMPNGAQTVGTLVGKMGKTTGWTEGAISGTEDWNGTAVIVAQYHSDRGDSGGPVWRYDGAGLRAVGMHVGSVVDKYTKQRIGAAYIPINTLLQQWGAALPVFPRTFATSKAAPSDMVQAEPEGSLALDPSLPNICADGNCVIIPE